MDGKTSIYKWAANHSEDRSPRALRGLLHLTSAEGCHLGWMSVLEVEYLLSSDRPKTRDPLAGAVGLHCVTVPSSDHNTRQGVGEIPVWWRRGSCRRDKGSSSSMVYRVLHYHSHINIGSNITIAIIFSFF